MKREIGKISEEMGKIRGKGRVFLRQEGPSLSLIFFFPPPPSSGKRRGIY